MKRKSNQRITKIKLDSILELLKKAEDTLVEDACTIEPSEDQLTPYPDMDSLRIWTRDYLTKGLNKILINKLADDGQTYMTTLVDGLPLFTKMSKTIQGTTPTEVISGFADNITSSNVTLDDKGIATFGSSSGTVTIPLTTVMKTNTTYELIFKLTGNPDSTNRYLLNFASNKAFCVRISIANNKPYLYCGTGTGSMTSRDTYLELNIQYKLTLTLGANSSFNIAIIKIEDGSTVFTSNTSSSQVNYMDQLNFGLDLINTEIDFTKSSITTSSGTINLLNTSNVYSTGETSKPGLWLSNLIQPVSQSEAGSWLRSNLIHSNNDKYSLINSYVVGNYSNTFTQPAIIMGLASLPDECDPKWKYNGSDNSTYNQHYSPVISSCLNYAHNKINSILQYGIQDFDYAFWYGSYQTIAFPSDPDMQKYTESDSSCLPYNFTNHDDDGATYNATPYVMKAANSSQRPNIHGSLTLKPDKTTGGSITGEFSSIDDDGNQCTTNINYIFRSVQAMFADDYEYTSSDNSLDNTTYKPIKAYTRLDTCCFYHYADFDDGVGFRIVGGDYRFKYSASMASGRSCRGVAYSTDGGNTYQYGFNSGNNYVYYDYGLGATCGMNSSSPSVDYDSSGYCRSNVGRLDGILLPSNTSTSDQSGINIYLHVKDLILEAKAAGIPYSNPDCTQSPYNIWVNTDGTTSSDYERVYLIAENVSIDSLGNISTINEKIINLE